MTKRAAVIGGGISGLCVAYRLKRTGVDVSLFESGADVGGNIQTKFSDGFLLEQGPNSTMASVELLGLLDDLHIRDLIAKPSTAAKNRYIIKHGKLVALPFSFFDLLKGDVFSYKAKLRLLKEPIVSSTSPEGESVAAFFERRLGCEIVKYAVDPFVSGIYAGDPEKLSIRSAFPHLFELERDHGSLLKAQLFGKKDPAKAVPKGSPRSITFARGMRTLIDALYSHLNDNIRLETAVQSIEKNGAGNYKLRGNGFEEDFDAVIVATPAHAAARLIDPIDNELAEKLSSIYYPPVAIVHTGFRHEQVKAACRGFGFLVPGGEQRRILGSLWTSSVFDERAPDGYHLFTTFIGGSRSAELCDNDEDHLIEIVIEELRSIVGIDGAPVLKAVKTWRKAIPQYNIDYESIPAAIVSMTKNNPGLYVCSNYYKGISVSDCIRNANSAAGEVIDLFKELESYQ